MCQKPVMMDTSSTRIDDQLNVDLHASPSKTNPVLDVMFDYTATDDDELTLRFVLSQRKN